MGQATPIRTRLAPAGHVGDGVLGVGRVLGRLPGEGGVDDVLGEDGDQGEQAEGQPLRDVELEDLGRPGEEEGRPDDRHAEDQRPDGRRRQPVGAQIERDARHRDGRRGGDQDPAAHGRPPPSRSRSETRRRCAGGARRAAGPDQEASSVREPSTPNSKLSGAKIAAGDVAAAEVSGGVVAGVGRFGLVLGHLVVPAVAEDRVGDGGADHDAGDGAEEVAG